MKASILACALLLSGPAGQAAASAAPADVRRTVIDGMQLEYRTTRDAKGALVLAGREAKSKRTFRLKVVNGWVRGEVDGQRVSFHVSEIEREAGPGSPSGRGR